MNRKKCLYLVSSSSSREYLADCLDALAFPRGMVHHFRYRENYIDKTLRDELRHKAGSLPARLSNMSVVVAFLFAEQSAAGNWEVGSHLPLRHGHLVDAFLEGDVGHFYFVVDGYILYGKTGKSSTKAIQQKLGGINFHTGDKPTPEKKRHDSYAHVGLSLLTNTAPSRDSEGFQSFVENAYASNQWRTISSGSSPLDITYDIVFFRIPGIYEEDHSTNPPKLREIEPELQRVPGCPFAEYPLKVDKTYRIKVMTHLPRAAPAQLPGRGRAFLDLKFEKQFFTTPGSTILKVSSPYDLQFWPIIPREVNRSVLTVRCQAGVRSDDDSFFVRREFLAPEVILPVNVTK